MTAKRESSKNKVRKVNKGATLGIVCPSFYTTAAERVERFLSLLKQRGYNYRLGKSTYSQDGYLAGTDDVRANDLMEMFLDDEIDAIICLLGGFGASRIVDKLDYQLIKNNPKLLIGFSDITVLLNALYFKAGIPSVHGLVGTFLGHPEIDEDSINDFFEIFNSDYQGRILKNYQTPALTLVPGVSEGVIVGGNLSLITALMGTPYEIDFTDKLVLIEEVEEKPYRIDRMFSSLRLSGALEKAKGYIFGKFTECTGPTKSYQALINEYFKDLNVPVIYEFQTGHELPFINVPIGLKAKLDAHNKEITILEGLYQK